MFQRPPKSYKIFKRAVSLSVTIFLTVLIVFIAFEPATVKGVSDVVVLTATVTSEVTISSPADTSFSDVIPGVTGNPGNPRTASVTWNVKTNNSTGFSMYLHASQTDALYYNGSYYFDDYGTTPGTPQYNWSSPPSGGAAMGFTVVPGTTADLATAFLDNGSSTCGSGAYHASKCWCGFDSTSDILVINRTSPTTSSGEDEGFNFNAESNGRLLTPGDYTATVTATANLN